MNGRKNKSSCINKNDKIKRERKIERKSWIKMRKKEKKERKSWKLPKINVIDEDQTLITHVANGLLCQLNYSQYRLVSDK